MPGKTTNSPALCARTGKIRRSARECVPIRAPRTAGVSQNEVQPMKMPSPFNSGEPVAYFLTWTTYGTWLPGDERGWNRKGEPEPLPPTPLFVEMARSEMKDTPFFLSVEARLLVEQTIRQHCVFRGWALHAVNARSNHVHVVVSAKRHSPETMCKQFKAWCTRRLKDSQPDRTRFWTEGGSCRWINQDDELASLMIYVLEAQDRKGTSP